MTNLYTDIPATSALEELAQRYGLEVIQASLPDTDDYVLHFDGESLGILRATDPKARVCVDFCRGAVAHRRKFGGGKGQDIAKAIGLGGSYCPSVVDATAGLGRDAFVLATLGCDVTALERQPVVAALLEDGLRRGRDDIEVADLVGRIELKHTVAHEWLANQPGDNLDVIYLDPMFEHDAKQKAAVKKDMQAFRSLVGQDEDADQLLEPALHAARCRVVVKRARKAPVMAGRAPSYSITGKSNRFDVYALAKVEAP
jgi:16S rRNA (guanine1516-N2)-methyltransferase